MHFYQTTSPFWTIGGIGLWLGILVLPLAIYFIIAAFQLGRPQRGMDLGPSKKEEPQPPEKEVQDEKKKAG